MTARSGPGSMKRNLIPCPKFASASQVPKSNCVARGAAPPEPAMQVLAPLGGRPTPGEPFQHRDVRRNCGALDGAEIGALIPCWSASRVFADDAVADVLGCGRPTGAGREPGASFHCYTV